MINRRIVDLSEMKKGQKYFDIRKEKKYETIQVERKRSVWIKILNYVFVSVLIISAIFLIFKYTYKKGSKNVVFYDLIPENKQSIYVINLKNKDFSNINSKNEKFDVFWEKIFEKLNKVLFAVAINKEKEIKPLIGSELSIVFLEDNNFVIFLELNDSLNDISYPKGKIEKELMKTCNVTYESYKNFSISSVKGLSEVWLDINYVFIDKYLVISNQKEILNQCIEKSIRME